MWVNKLLKCWITICEFELSCFFSLVPLTTMKWCFVWPFKHPCHITVGHFLHLDLIQVLKSPIISPYLW